MARLHRTWKDDSESHRDSAGLIIEGRRGPDPKVLCHRDLNALDIVAVPKRFMNAFAKRKRPRYSPARCPK